ncbi:DUF4401 domain-containing protein [Psychrobacter sp. P11G5]|uniref:DUF4401 domain-containing protein n=1 Tax=Psychrobacter sp. P11G5 TaxID=1699624 RepID=UPI00078E386B|nr:DUF4401 domain-containing protein [Psychrobacter sp. P11G5]AMN66321.1 hypothetical protein AK825_00095 [Psychrobacter sp. P11G5]
MNSKHSNDIFVQLQQHGLINTTSVENKTEPYDDTPWFIHLFFGLSGLLASLFFIGFLTLILEQTGVLDSAIALFIIGTLLSAAGLALFKSKHSRRSTFMNSLAFAISIVGQIYIMFALLSNELEQPFSVWLFLLIQLIMTIVMPNFLYRLLSATVALGCMVYLLNFYSISEVSLGLLALITVVNHLQRYSLLQRIPTKWRSSAFAITKAVAYASAIMLLSISIYFIAAEYGNSFLNSNETSSYNYFLAQGLLTLASLYAAHLILRRYQIKLLSAAGLMIASAIISLGIMSVYVSGLLATSLIIIIATANSQRVLLGFGIFALVSYIFWYYYQLDTSLLVKSVSMLIIGISLLMMRWLLVKRYFSGSKERAL